MKRDYRFDLEQAVRSWRAFLSGQESLDAADMNELENHLREDVQRWNAAGMSDEDAFRKAVLRLGNVTDLAGSYGAVRTDRWFTGDGRRFQLGLIWDRLTSYALIARRNLVRSPGYTALNTLGLALGMAVALLTGLFIRQHVTFDRSIPDSDRIYRVTNIPAEGSEPMAISPGGLDDVLRTDVAAVESATALMSFDREFQYLLDGEAGFLSDFLQVDSSFVDVFSIEIIRGSRRGLLNSDDEVVLTESTSRQLFGDEDPVGRTLTRFPDREYTITAIVADPPANSSLTFRGLFGQTPRSQPLIWNSYTTSIFVKATPESQPGAIESTLNAMIERDAEEDYEQGRRIVLQPLRDVHLDPTVQYGASSTIDPRFLLMFGIVGAALLLVACINHVNLSTARAGRRAREVGVRKVVGASRSSLMRQFMGESLLMTFAAFPVALLVASILAPRIEYIMDFPFDLWGLMDGQALWFTGLLLCGTGFSAGLYPAFILSGFRPGSVLKGYSASLLKGNRLRRVLVGTQVAASLILICTAVVVVAQIRHIMAMDLGFNKSQVIVLNDIRTWTDAEVSTFRARLTSDPAVLSTATGMAPGIGQKRKSSGFWRDDKTMQMIESLPAGPGYFDLLKIGIEEGRVFGPQDATDSTKVAVLTRSMANILSPNEPALGQTFNFIPDERRVIGIVGDILNNSTRAADFPPIYFHPEGERQSSILVRTLEGNTTRAIQTLENTWKELHPDQVFRFTFLDEAIAAQYASDERLARLFSLLGAVCVLIACLGLVGLATYSAQRRIKEIGIRKVLGAKAWQIVSLLTRDVLAVILVSAAIAVPLVYLAAQKWLEKFSERITVGPGLFLLSVGLLTALVALSVAVQTIRAANRNPADSLRYE